MFCSLTLKDVMGFHNKKKTTTLSLNVMVHSQSSIKLKIGKGDTATGSRKN